MVVLYFVKTIELKLPSVRRGTLTVTVGRDGPVEGEVRKVILASAFQMVSTGAVYDQAAEARRGSASFAGELFPDESDEPEFFEGARKHSKVSSHSVGVPRDSGLHGGVDRRCDGPGPSFGHLEFARTFSPLCAVLDAARGDGR